MVKIVTRQSCHRGIKPVVDTDKLVLVRIGSRKHVEGHYDIILNKPENIAISSNKVRMVQEFVENEVPTAHQLSYEDVLVAICQGCRVVAKLKKHKRAIGMVRFDNQEELISFFAKRGRNRDNYYFETFEEITDEYRVHVFDGVAVHVDKKVLKPDGHETWIRSHRNYRFVHCPTVLSGKIRKYAVKAAEAVGLDFCAVDVGYNRTTEEVIVFETNSEPGMRTKLVGVYNEQLKKMIERRLAT